MAGILLKNITLNGSQRDISICGGIISKISDAGSSAGDSPESEVIDCTGKAAFPGFVNMHTHAGMSLMRGMQEDVPFQEWINNIWDIEAKLDADFVYWSSKVSVIEMIKTGTTTYNDQYWFAPWSRKAALELGITPAVSYVIIDRGNPDEVPRQIDQCQRMYERSKIWPGDAPFCISFHAIYSVSEPLIVWASEFANKNNLNLHIHLSETRKEMEDCMAAHGGLSPVEYLDRLGVLGPHLIAAHSLWLSENDIRLLGENKVNCVHNINSNLKLSSGYKFKYQELKEAGANVCIGTDGCASSNNLDMLEAMKTSALLQKAWRNDPKAMPLEELAAAATVNGAKALRLNTGVIEEGKRADILIVDTDNTYFLSPGSFLANFVYSAHSDCIESVIAGGKFVMRNREIPGEKEILQKARGIIRQIMN